MRRKLVRHPVDAGKNRCLLLSGIGRTPHHAGMPSRGAHLSAGRIHVFRRVFASRGAAAPAGAFAVLWPGNGGAGRPTTKSAECCPGRCPEEVSGSLLIFSLSYKSLISLVSAMGFEPMTS
jgi:hypothetical protein